MSEPSRLCYIDASQPDRVITSGHLRLGGADPHGNRLEVTDSYLTWNGRPFYVISGEFHFSRCPESGWEEALKKIKAGGLRALKALAQNAGLTGFLFVNNLQDHVAMQALPDVAAEINTPAGELRIPETGSLTVQAETCCVLPFNQKLGDGWLIYATAQPLAMLNSGSVLHYFYFAPEGIDAEYCFAKDTVVRLW